MCLHSGLPISKFIFRRGLSTSGCRVVRGEILTFPGHSHYYSGVIPMVFQHSGGRDFDLHPRHSHYSGVIPMVFQHSGGRDFDLPRHSHYSGVIPMVFQHSVVAFHVRRETRKGIKQFVCNKQGIVPCANSEVRACIVAFVIRFTRPISVRLSLPLAVSRDPYSLLKSFLFDIR